MTTPRPDALTVERDVMAVLVGDELPVEDERAVAWLAAIKASVRERYRHGWCCDYDFDNGTYRTTPECIGRTRDADAVERELREAAKAYRDLTACLRIGKTPSEALFRRLAKADAALAKESR